MKKIIITTTILASLFFMTGCSLKSSEKADSNLTGETTEMTDIKDDVAKDREDGYSIFEGKLSVDPTIKEDDVTLSFENVDAINDPDEIHDTINSNGVILNAQKKQFENEDDISELKKGSVVQFTLEKSPALTFSIPPQIPGNSIKSIRVIPE